MGRHHRGSFRLEHYAEPRGRGGGLEQPEEQRSALIEHLESNGVPESSQNTLADKIEAGEPLESEIKSAIPIRETSTTQNGFTVTRKDYSDGSFMESSVEIGETAPPGAVEPQAIKGCSSTGGSGHRQMSNCLVYVNAPTYSANFRATWVYQQNGTGVISKAWDSSLQVYLGTYSNKTFSITRKTSSGSTPAQVQLKWKYTAVGGVAQGDSAIYLNVSANDAWTTTN